MSNESSALPSAHPAFTPLRQQTIDSLNIRVEQFEHTATGAMHYHLAADYSENVFLVAQRTVPQDSTGVAHILEHTALCGSERYPVRDPFFMMLRRSLNTFMNAFTSSDWTAYPFASQNRKDFDNLLQVYLDAVFFSRLDPLDFAQEGHRVEFAEPDNPESDLVFKGVVFNEMKGAMSSVTSTLWQKLCEQLFPSTTYHYNSGGDPEHIPDLSYQQLVDFYRSHYHPSNSIFMTFGDIPAAELQAVFEERALQRFQRLDQRIQVRAERRLDAPLRIEDCYAFDESGSTDNRTHLVMGCCNMHWKPLPWARPPPRCAAWKTPCGRWCSAAVSRAARRTGPTSWRPWCWVCWRRWQNRVSARNAWRLCCTNWNYTSGK
jgi:Zn-dependent M16 (insulinase) family peptidase